MAIKIINIEGTSQNNCGCGSWIDHWKKFSGSSLPDTCREATCYGKPEVGAHVQKSGDSNWYIIPLCSKHNQKANELSVMDSTVFVSANVSQTCGR